MLKHRLIFGTLMTVAFIGLVLFDAWLDGSFGSEKSYCPVYATLLTTFLVIVAMPANLELSSLANSAGAKIFLPITIPGTILLSTAWYWAQFFENRYEFMALFFAFFLCIYLLLIFLWQGIKFASVGAFANLGGNLIALIYLGMLTSLVLAVRIDFGPFAFLMYIFVVKCSDIGAYTAGRLFGRHKFSPVLSPKKTWEGMAGACIFAAVVSSIFAKVFGIMGPQQAILFGIIFAFAGQLGDLAESMLKRAAEKKDSSGSVPGFGGILDVIDSPLATGVLAYLFFMLIS
ncbi:MAG: phosphatidate cytidylyltransferase [Sedimentisphaerales bacterium]|nr:phosphatidate cytidylyltransferase [Sedimentisphaerales bacterium]